MSSSELKPQGLYVALYIRDDPPKPNDFHWALYLHESDSKGGTKYHVKGRQGRWMAHHTETKRFLKEALLVGLFQIAAVPDGLQGKVDENFRLLDDKVNEISITCRTWVFRVLEIFRGSAPSLIQEDLGALEAEIKEWGNQHAQSASMNEQPRPIGVSERCKA
ncbi:uncharacterized protein J3D65DRAFT_612010 [Phyllosticta citribraziliensis]|uniref:Uncharacterized protein n=1 Tax=Phyllosticta citribraziliensis TaxID=989973 RepID=A0ABR1M4T2_9PEZI